MELQDHTEWKLLFSLFDMDNNGTLDKEEFRKLLQLPNSDGRVFVSEEQINEFLNLADADGSEDISMDEFLAFMKNNVPQGVYSLKSIFQTIDSSGDGFIERHEFEEAKQTRTDLNKNLINILDKAFQIDTVNKISYEEFYQHVNEHCGKMP